MAGGMTAEEIADALGRTPQAVVAMAHRSGVSLRLDARTETCARCGRRSVTVDAAGLCEPCRERALLDAVEERMRDELAAAPHDVRERYARFTRFGSAPVQPPPKPQGATRAETERWMAECEHAEAMTLRRRRKASQKRLERIRRWRFHGDGE